MKHLLSHQYEDEMHGRSPPDISVYSYWLARATLGPSKRRSGHNEQRER